MIFFRIPMFVGGLAVAAQSVHSTYMPEHLETRSDCHKFFVPFQDFLERVRTASYSQYKNANMSCKAYPSHVYGVTAAKVTSSFWEMNTETASTSKNSLHFAILNLTQSRNPFQSDTLSKEPNLHLGKLFLCRLAPQAQS
jgi:hypothetical protein